MKDRTFLWVNGRFGHGRFGQGRFGHGRFGQGRFGQINVPSRTLWPKAISTQKEALYELFIHTV